MTHGCLTSTRAMLTSLPLLAVASLGCNFATDLDQARDDALERRTPARQATDACVEYCGLVTTFCDTSAATRIYEDEDACFAACELFPNDGVVGETSGDTVNCRVTHAKLAEFGGIHCSHASPDGGGVCTGDSPCGTYCTSIIEHCTGPHEIVFSGDDAMPNIHRCLAVCSSDYDRSGHAGDTTGDTLQCRDNAADLATDDPATFCPQAGPDGGGVCVD